MIGQTAVEGSDVHGSEIIDACGELKLDPRFSRVLIDVFCSIQDLILSNTSILILQYFLDNNVSNTRNLLCLSITMLLKK